MAAALGSGMRPPWHPDEPMTLVAFRELKAAFDAADEDGGGDLDVDEFVATFRRILPDATRSELRALFAKIDTNSSETVDWDEFSSYVLLAEDANERMRGDRGGATYAPPDRSMRALFDNRTRHKDLMTRVTRLPKTDQYASVSRDGTLRVWNHERAAAASGKTSKHSAAVAAAVGGKLADALLPPFSLHRVVHPGSAYLNDAALLPVTDRLAVASHDRCVRVYETKGWTESGASRSFDHAPLCLAAFAGGRRVAPGARDVDHLIVGDDGGALHLLDVIDLTDGEKAEVGGTASVKVQRRWRKKIHDGWVHALARCDAGDAPGTPGFVASGGADCCLRLTDLATGACFKTFGPNAQTSNPHVKAIHAVAFCASDAMRLHRRRRPRRARLDAALQRPLGDAPRPRPHRLRHPGRPGGAPGAHAGRFEDDTGVGRAHEPVRADVSGRADVPPGGPARAPDVRRQTAAARVRRRAAESLGARGRRGARRGGAQPRGEGGGVLAAVQARRHRRRRRAGRRVAR